MKALLAFIAIIAVAVAGYFGYRALSKPKTNEEARQEIQTTSDATSSPTELTKTNPPAMTATNPTARIARPAPKTPKPQPTGEWKPKLDGILASTVSPQMKLQQIKDLLSNLPAEEAEQATQALAASVKDENFAFLKPLVVDPTLPEPARDEFMVDLMNRPNSIKIPLFLELARNPDHPDHESAFDSLEAFTGLKLGADWAGWENGIQQWLKEHPDVPRKSQIPAGVEANQ